MKGTGSYASFLLDFITVGQGQAQTYLHGIGLLQANFYIDELENGQLTWRSVNTGYNGIMKVAFEKK